MPPSPALRILLVEDEESLALMLRYNFEAEGYQVDVAADGEEAALLAEEHGYDIIVLDWMLPGISGIELCRRFRHQEQTQSTPIIMLTARGEEADRIRGLTTGADDYVVKPFSVPELLARMQAVLRRSAPHKLAEELQAGPLTLDRKRWRATCNGTPLNLSRKELQLLECFMQHPGQVFSRTQLLDAIWGDEAEVEPRTVDVAISRLRKTLATAGVQKNIIRTLRGLGYALDITPPATQADTRR